MRRRRLRAVSGLAAALLAIAAAPAPAQEPAAPAAAPLRLTAALDTTATTVGGSLMLELRATSAEGWSLDPPTPSLDLGEAFRVRGVEPLTVAEGAAWRLRLIALQPGEMAVGPVELTARGAQGATAPVRTEALPVRVESNLPPPVPPADGEAPPDEPAPADLKPALEAERDWLPLILAAAALVVALALGFWLFRKLRNRRAPEEAPASAPRRPLRPAWEIALEELDRIAAADYVGKGALDRQYVEVTTALRQYLEDRYGVPALESTTTDLRPHLERSPLAAEMSSRLLNLLREADLVKFAKAEPEVSAARSTEMRVREFVRATMPREKEAAG